MVDLPVTIIPDADLNLAPAVWAFIDAVNNGDISEILPSFANDAVVNDQLVEYAGIEAIEGWAQAELMALNVRILVRETRLRHTGMIVIAQVEGDFDGFGLPEPLFLRFYFSLGRNLIDQLIILRKDI